MMASPAQCQVLGRAWAHSDSHALNGACFAGHKKKPACLATASWNFRKLSHGILLWTAELHFSDNRQTHTTALLVDVSDNKQ